MADDRKQLTTERINQKVALYRGCTLDELVKIGIVSLSSSMVIMILLMTLLFNSALIGVALALPVAVVQGLLLVKVLHRLKKDKPFAYYDQWLQLRLADWGIMKANVVRRSGSWSVTRFRMKS